MLKNRRFSNATAGIFLAGILATARPSLAQTSPTKDAHAPHVRLAKSELDSVIEQLDTNIDEFNRTIPSFFSREEVSSEEEPGPNGMHSLRTNTSSTFVVRRSGDPDDPDDPANDSDNPTKANALHESRVVRVIDEKGFVKPEGGTNKLDTSIRMDSPYVIFGIFSGAITRISTAGKACFHYRLHPARPGHDGGRIVIEFESWPRKDRDASCPYSDRITGRGFIDPVSMRMVRLEDKEVDDKGVWTWSVDYAPISLGDAAFWLPTIIRSGDVNTSDSSNNYTHVLTQTSTSHRLVAKYSNYRQAKVPSSTAGGTPAAQH